MTDEKIANTGGRLVFILPNQVTVFGQLREIIAKGVESGNEVVLVHLNKIRFIRKFGEIETAITDILKIQALSKGVLANTEAIIPKIKPLAASSAVVRIFEERSPVENAFDTKLNEALPCLIKRTFAALQVINVYTSGHIRKSETINLPKNFKPSILDMILKS